MWGLVMPDNVLAQLAALRAMPVADLKVRWQELFDTPAPRYNRRFLESRLAYRIQELAYGGLSEVTLQRLDALARDERLVGREKTRKRVDDRPVAGTRLIREWQGVEHCVTVLREGYEYQGQSYKSLSAIARRITGSRWNGPMFFGLRPSRRPA